MKRFLIVLGVVLACGVASSVASAQEAYFGVRFGFPFLIGVQGGADFGERGDGFGVRGVAEGTFLGSAVVYNLAVDAYNRFRLTEEGTNAYVGLGAGLVGAGVFGSGSGSGFDAHLLAGIEFRLNPGFGLFLELTPLWVVFPSGASAQVVTFPFFSLGGNFRF
jgi:hypothetical protein